MNTDENKQTKNYHIYMPKPINVDTPTYRRDR